MKNNKSTNIALVSFELGVVIGYENVRSAHIQSLYSLAEGLSKHGNAVTIITNRPREGTFIPEDLQQSVDIKYIADPRKRKSTNVMDSGFSKGVDIIGTFRSIYQTLKIMRIRKINIIHYVNGGIEIGLYSSIIKLLGLGKIKVFWTPSLGKLRQHQTLLLKILRSLNKIIVATEYQHRMFAQHLDNIKTIKSGITRCIKLEEAEKFRVTFWRDPSYENGADIAQKTFIQLSSEFPDIIFTMLVRKHYASVVKTTTRMLRDNIKIYEYPYEHSITLEKVLSETILCYFPFRELSTNPQLCVLESVNAGIPCVVPKIESLQEYILDSDYLLDSNSVESAVDKITGLLKERAQLPAPTSPQANGFKSDYFIDLHIQTYLQ